MIECEEVEKWNEMTEEGGMEQDHVGGRENETVPQTPQRGLRMRPEQPEKWGQLCTHSRPELSGTVAPATCGSLHSQWGGMN